MWEQILFPSVIIAFQQYITVLFVVHAMQAGRVKGCVACSSSQPHNHVMDAASRIDGSQIWNQRDPFCWPLKFDLEGCETKHIILRRVQQQRVINFSLYLDVVVPHLGFPQPLCKSNSFRTDEPPLFWSPSSIPFPLRIPFYATV